MLRRTEYSGIFQVFPFSLPLPEALGDFSPIFIMRTWWSSQRSNSQKCGGLRYDWVPLEFLVLRIVHTEPPEILQLQLRFSYPTLVSAEVSVQRLCFCSGELWLSVSVCLSNLAEGGQHFAL